MPNLFARQTALTNVGGRIDYISNPARQEHLLAVHDGAADLVAGAYWHQLAQECKAASKHATPGRKCVQGRELIIQLSNALLQRMTPEEIAEKLATSFEQKYHRPCMVAVHMNKTETNLHAHLIYSERDLLKDPEEKVAPRALFFDEEGKRQYKKAAILDESGELRPGCRIVAKGEIYERRCFGAVNQTFCHKGWLRAAKKEWLLPLRNGDLKGDVEISEYDPSSGKLAQQHVGKVEKVDSSEAQEKAVRIQAYNQEVKVYNRLVDTGIVHPAVAAGVQTKVRQAPERNSVLQALVAHLLQICRAMAEKKRQQDVHRNLDPTERKSVKELLEDAKSRADEQRKSQHYEKRKSDIER